MHNHQELHCVCRWIEGGRLRFVKLFEIVYIFIVFIFKVIIRIQFGVNYRQSLLVWYDETWLWYVFETKATANQALHLWSI